MSVRLKGYRESEVVDKLNSNITGNFYFMLNVLLIKIRQLEKKLKI